jgi:nicotinate-nucleotide adenylyltransferase
MAAAQEVLEALELDRILFVPAAVPPHKQDEAEGMTPGPLRMRMLKAAVGDDPRFSLSDLELRREGVSWTVDTVRDLREARPDAAFYLVLGADQWRAFGTWREPWEIARRATPVVMTREGEGVASSEHELPGCLEVPVPRIDISSTDIRERVRDGRSIRYLVPDDVRRIIEAAKLYL